MEWVPEPSLLKGCGDHHGFQESLHRIQYNIGKNILVLLPSQPWPGPLIGVC